MSNQISSFKYILILCCLKHKISKDICKTILHCPALVDDHGALTCCIKSMKIE